MAARPRERATRSHGFRAVAFALATLGVARPSAAQGRDPAAAEALFDEGRRAMAAGEYAEACAHFAESQRMDPAAGTLINLAECLAKQGKLASAWEKWREALGALGPADNRRRGVERRIAELDRKVPRLTIRLDASAPADSEVERDGVRLGAIALGLPLPIDPGTHTLVIRAPGHEDARAEIEIVDGEKREITVGPGAPVVTPVPVASPEAAPPAEADPRPPERGPPVLGYVTLGVGVAALAVGGISGAVALGKKGVMDDECAREAGILRCSDAGLDAAASGRTFAAVANVGVAVGLVGVAAGLYLILSTPGQDTVTAVSMRPVPGGSGLFLEHVFR
jgi:hypothetical protein